MTPKEIDRREAMRLIASAGVSGLQDEEIQAAMPRLTLHQARCRRGELWAYGLITDNLGLQRPISTGSTSKAWHCTEAGLRALDLDPETNWHSAKRAANE